ncbi:hypothetical protein [Pseudomonas syringae]|uniref:hypothetical protein n=1 Tax=Pseudomonas syringae TaxID=317 RepID=UPI00200A55D1|nr:hypothetical protein [Pseudomonas syringae]MCK9733909.1 hypothetical protein [Pseudomonas syringae pv. syringae]
MELRLELSLENFKLSGAGGSGRDAFADHCCGEGEAVFQLEAEKASAGVAVHVLSPYSSESM